LSYVDAHLHLADPGFSGRVEGAIDDANKSNVAFLLSNAVDFDTSIQTIALAKRYPAKVLAAIGVHPSTATRTADLQLDKFEQLIRDNADHVSAIGEIGLDGKYTQDETLKKRQRDVFRFFLSLAERKGLPVVVHSRLAVNEVLETLSDFHLSKVLLHWYDGPVELGLLTEKGYMISIGPAVYTSRTISEIAQKADLDMILTETDGPVNYRGPFEGKPTQPSFVVEVVRKLAEIKTVSTDTMRRAVERNFRELIQLGSPRDYVMSSKSKGNWK
jgi:TatD DNase family protein